MSDCSSSGVLRVFGGRPSPQSVAIGPPTGMDARRWNSEGGRGGRNPAPTCGLSA